MQCSDGARADGDSNIIINFKIIDTLLSIFPMHKARFWRILFHSSFQFYGNSISILIESTISMETQRQGDRFSIVQCSFILYSVEKSNGKCKLRVFLLRNRAQFRTKILSVWFPSFARMFSIRFRSCDFLCLFCVCRVEWINRTYALFKSVYFPLLLWREKMSIAGIPLQRPIIICYYYYLSAGK